MREWSGRVVSCLLMVALLPLTGCMTATTITPQSHFDYPNSNVYPLARTKAGKTAFGLFVQPGFHSRLKERTFQKAMAKVPESELLVNCITTEKTVVIPLMFLQIYFQTFKVTGTAAKMEIGTQALQ